MSMSALFLAKPSKNTRNNDTLFRTKHIQRTVVFESIPQELRNNQEIKVNTSASEDPTEKVNVIRLKQENRTKSGEEYQFKRR